MKKDIDHMKRITMPSYALVGVEARLVSVSVTYGKAPMVLGVSQLVAHELTLRVFTAVQRAGYGCTPNALEIAPLELKKPANVYYDLPVAVAHAAHQGAQLPHLDGLLLAGGIGLMDDSLRDGRGAVAAALLALREGLRGILVPPDHDAEAAAEVVPGVEVYTALTFQDVLEGRISRVAPRNVPAPAVLPKDDFRTLRLPGAQRAAEIAAAGGHHMLIVGPISLAGNMVAHRMPGILPPVTDQEYQEICQVYSADARPCPRKRPYRVPPWSVQQHQVSGARHGVGEASRAHRGVLFMDEITEFGAAVKQTLRQAVENGRVYAPNGTSEIVAQPAEFLLVASARRCACGWAGSTKRSCLCPPNRIAAYRQKTFEILGPWFDMQVTLPDLDLADISRLPPCEDSLAIRERVVAARARQAARLEPYNLRYNAQITRDHGWPTCRFAVGVERGLQGLAADASERVTRVARTIADLNHHDDIEWIDLYEAKTHTREETLV
jgi:magnesium chelatase family protein